MKKIILTGGGTAGHVTPNLALVPALKQKGFEIKYIGSVSGMEKGLVEAEGIPYFGISSGKLRRYFSWQNFTDPFRVVKGYFQARKILKKERPDVLFSKGGFVSAPVVWAARSLKIPSVIHESDMTPGLANRLCFKAATKVCCNFPETLTYLPAGKALVSGCPIRQELLTGSKEAGLAFAGLDGVKPVLLVIGGSSGALSVNQKVREALPELLKTFDVIHLTGKGKADTSVSYPGYVQFEYISAELKDLFAAADLVISRAGANAICELLALQKPALLIPYGTAASRGDQVLNADSFVKQGFSLMLDEEGTTGADLLEKVKELQEKKGALKTAMAASPLGDAITTVTELLDSLT